MADCGISPVGCLKDIGKGIITQCLWPPIKSHIDYWWCFDDNIQVLRDGVWDLDRETLDINQKIEEARLRTDKLRPGVEDWSKAGTEKLGEARIILQDDINPKAWNLISRYSMGKRAKKAAEEIAKHRNDGKFNVIADPAPPPAMGRTPHRSSMDFESRKRIEEDIIKYMKKNSVGMIGICGIGGVGKTTMARRIRERVMEENLFDEVVMVVVSQQIDMLKIQEEIADWLKLKFDERSMSARADKLRTRLMDTKRKIIIFDDVWERLKLEDLGVPFESGCKILLTTRSKDVCEKMEAQEIIPMKILTKEESWILFKEKAGNCVEDSTLFPVAEEVVAKCNGLPIALVTVGKALRDKKKSIWVDSLSQLSEANPADFPEVISDVYNPLKLSYDYLDNERERLLFLLCCLFPEDYDIPVEELTLYFMGLRKFDGSPRIEEARNRTDRLVEKLQSRFLLIEGEEKHHVKMHDVVRDVAIFIGSKEKYGFLRSLNKISIENSSDINCNWMSVDISNQPMNVDMGLRFPKLHLLMLLGLRSDISSEGIGDFDVSFEGIGDLNVLSFSDISIGSLPPTLGLLQNLKTLYLYNCKVENISVIGELAGLEILYCYDCDEIKELPAKIGRLSRLRLLELNGCGKRQKIPFGILSSLVRLEELKLVRSFDGWEAEENGKEKRNASIRELECLTNLTCLDIEISDSNLAAQEIRLSPKLVKYYILIGRIDYWYDETADYEKVMKLKLPSGIGAVGKWIQNLAKNTEYLKLEGDGSNNINLEECQVNLRNLRVEKCSTLKKVVKTKDCKSGIVFPMLERLKLKWLDNLEEIWDGTIILNQNNVSSLCNLKFVRISHCSKLRYLFSVSVATTWISQLEDLDISHCWAMEQVFRNDITDDGCIEFPKLKELTLRYLPNLKKVAKTKDNCKSGIVFPMLERLRLEYLNNLEEIWDGTIILNQNNVSSLSNLKFIRIYDCSKLRYLFSVSVATTWISQLEDLEIIDCWAMEQVFRNDITDDGCIEFPKLKGLVLQNLPNLKKVVKTKDNCKSGIVFPMLERLNLEWLYNLEEIWDGTIILNQNNVSSLRNLKSVEIYRCSKLRYLLSVSVATTACLLQLEELKIDKCEAMEQVFRNDITDDGCIEFPKLKKLTLENLLNLTAFCQGFENIKFPNLTQMWIEELPKLGLNSKTGNDDTNSFHLLCNPKVEIGGLKTLVVQESFNNLKKLTIYEVNGIRSLISYSIAINLVSLQSLEIRYCEELVEVIEGNDDDKDVVDIKCLFPTLKTLKFEKLPKLRWFWKLNHILELPLLEKVEINDCQVMETIFALGSLNTPKLKELRLVNLPNLKAFCQGGENIKFPQLTEMWIEELPKLNSFCPLNSETPHDDGNPFHYFCNPKVEIGGLKTLTVAKFNYNNIRNIWCHQIPINFFHNLEKLSIYKINGIRSLMSYSIAKNLVSLRSLEIWDCEEMVDVIEGNDDDKDVVDIKCLFPTLKTLQFYKLPKLRRFWKLNQSLELPLLEEVRIDNCQVMETFTLGSLNTPNLMELMINGKEVYDMKNLNDILNHHIRIENHNTSMIEDYEDEYEEDEDEEDEDEDKNNGQGREQH